MSKKKKPFRRNPPLKKIKLKKIKLEGYLDYPLFMGNGIESMGRAYTLIIKHQECYNRLSGTQQGILIDSMEFKRSERENWNAACEIFQSITGYDLVKVECK